jgi:hypothetical protein
MMMECETGREGEEALLEAPNGEGLFHDPGFHQAQLQNYQHAVLSHQNVISFHKFEDTADIERMKSIYKSFLKCPECMGQVQPSAGAGAGDIGRNRGGAIGMDDDNDEL